MNKIPVSEDLLDKLRNTASKLTDADVEALCHFSERMIDMNLRVSASAAYSIITFYGTMEEVNLAYSQWKENNKKARIICVMVARHPKNAGEVMIKANFIKGSA